MFCLSISWDIDNVCKYFQGLYFILFFYCIGMKVQAGVFFCFFYPSSEFLAKFFCSPKLMLWLKTELLCLKLTTEGWWCPLFKKKNKKKHEIFSVVCAIYALNLRCVFSLFLYTHFKEIKVHLFFINTFLMKFCCRHKSKELKNAGSERNLTWPVMWR